MFLNLFSLNGKQAIQQDIVRIIILSLKESALMNSHVAYCTICRLFLSNWILT